MGRETARVPGDTLAGPLEGPGAAHGREVCWILAGRNAHVVKSEKCRRHIPWQNEHLDSREGELEPLIVSDTSPRLEFHMKQKPREPTARGAFTFWRALEDLNLWPSDS